MVLKRTQIGTIKDFVICGIFKRNFFENELKICRHTYVWREFNKVIDKIRRKGLCNIL